MSARPAVAVFSAWPVWFWAPPVRSSPWGGGGRANSEAKAEGRSIKVGKVPFAAIGKAIANNHTDGFVKVIIDAESHLVLGVTIVGHHASDIISEACLAIEMHAEALDIGLTIHPHPTLGESVMEATKAALGEAIHVMNR